MRFLLLPIFLIILSAGCSQSEPTKVDLHYPETYIIHKTTSDISIDGKMTELDWLNAKWTSDFIDIEGLSKPLPFYRTRTKMLWDDDFLYFYAEMEEEHIWGDITDRDAVIFYNNDFEVFINPDLDEPHYVEFEVNALGTLWELILLKPYRIGGPVSNYWDLNETIIGIDIDGTLNNPTDTDSMWTIEMAIPLKPVAEMKRGSKVIDGTIWKMNFSRVQWQYDIVNGEYDRKKNATTGKYLPEYNWVWSPQYAIDMHRPEHWGLVQFSDSSSSVNVTFNEPLFEWERQLLFHLHRKQLDYKREHGTFAGDITELGGPVFEHNSDLYIVHLMNTASGYELTIRNPQKGNITLNNQEFISISK